MEKEKQGFGQGKTEVFLVYDKTFKNNHAPFFKWLSEEEKFSYAGHGYWDCCPWIFIDITRKQYAYGMPGMRLAAVIGNHAITVNEFKTIYNIYKKYEGKELFVFHSE